MKIDWENAKSRKLCGFGYYQQFLAWALDVDKALRTASLLKSQNKNARLPREIRNRLKVWHYLSFSPWSNLVTACLHWRIRRIELEMGKHGKETK